MVFTPALLKTRSKFLSLVLRHEPQAAGITLDAQGWVDVEALLAGCTQAGHPINRELLEAIVRESDKQRFALSRDGAYIRANQGHSVEVDLGYTPQTPPEFLYHGTAKRFLESIKQSGLKPQNRHHVHLSVAKSTAIQVGSRHGQPIVLVVRSGDLHRSGVEFYCSNNGVWLCKHVPPTYLQEA